MSFDVILLFLACFSSFLLFFFEWAFFRKWIMIVSLKSSRLLMKFGRGQYFQVQDFLSVCLPCWFMNFFYFFVSISMNADWLKNLKEDFLDKFPARTVTVTGDGKVTAHSDTAILSFSLILEAPTVKQVTAEGKRKKEAIMAAMKELKVTPNNIEVSKYNLSPDYHEDKKKAQRIGSYHLEKEMVIKVKKLELVDKILDVVTKAGSNKISLVFDVAEPSAFKRLARKKALLDARKKAEEMAEVAGVRIGRVMTFSEDESEHYPTHSVPSSRIGFVDVHGDSSSPISVVESGSKEFTTSVNVTYEIS